MFLTVGEDAFGEEYVLKLCGGMYSGVWQGKPSGGGIRSSQFIYDSQSLLVKHLRCINCLNA